MAATDTLFYSNLHLHYGSIHELINDEEAFTDVPNSWNIIVTDVEKSTQAVQAGKQQLVNLAATGSIVACLNISRAKGVEIPFFFGGDGATLIVPNEILNECLFALNLHQERCSISFDFFLRVGYRKVGEMVDKGASLKILKYKRNDLHLMPVILGNALQMAENEIKASPPVTAIEQFNFNLDLNGMECKWDKISPPDNKNEIISLIIKARKVEDQSRLYSQILEKIELIYGDDTIRHPIVAKRLKMVNSLSRIKAEVKMKFKNVTPSKLVSSWWRGVMGGWFTKNTKKGKNYINDLIQLTETLLLDGSINTVITGNVGQREQLLEYLDGLENDHLINYGYYSSSSSVLSCFVTAIDDYHIHFLDGENGGYTQASKVLKAKMKLV
ncbi:Protein of unknown function (DUF3095) [Nonlabens xylanidelens]|uniref:DUF3095 family protein n=1 Tax=Nonlabens xylanidelens TaxID=191564 RepID=A0A2S6IEE0_9FLAO|nr:DUF3095 family protein [Nonlabens xylanidelens]PPK92571.1 Protein of unknown function (DUF3095) [Nonlabens xylanidelens]PQJ22026.1 hypothetical protein BST94_00155 [Nonlabens xylanidelens]